MSTVDMSIELNGLLQLKTTKHQLSVPQLVEKILARREGTLTSTGAVSVETGKYTGRSPLDKFIVSDAVSSKTVEWGPVNQPISAQRFDALYKKVLNHLKKQDELFVFNGYA